MPFADVNGIRMFYRKAGTGEEVFFIHGAGTTGRIWDLQLLPLFEAGFTVVTVDLRGHGATERGEELQTIPLFSEDIIRLMDVLGMEKAHLVGFSMGGLIAQRMAIDHPGRVRSLTLINTYSFLSLEYVCTLLGLTEDERGVLGKDGIAPENLGRILDSRSARRDAGCADMMHKAAAVLFPDEDQEIPKRLFFADSILCESEKRLRDIQCAAYAFNSSTEIGAISCPTLVLGSDRDISTILPFGTYLKRSIPGAALEVIEGSNHYVSLDSHDALDRIIGKFLRSVSGSR